MPTVACKWCRNDFVVSQSRLDHNRGEFCSQKCFFESKAGLPKKYPAEYMAYQDAKRRCKNPYYAAHLEGYKKRGIEFLFNSFEEFIEHIGPRPAGSSLDRIDNDGNYCAGNVRWATAKQQAQNRRSSVIYEFNGISMCASDWDKKLGLARGSTTRRIQKYGWPVEKALTTPSPVLPQL